MDKSGRILCRISPRPPVRGDRGIIAPVKYRFSTLQSSLFFGFAGVIGLILAACFAFFYAFFSVYCDESVSNSHKNLCSSISGAVDAEILKMNTVSMNVVYSNLISENLRDYLGSGRADPGPAGKWKSASTIFDMIWAIIGPFQTVSQVNIYSRSGDAIGAGIYNMEESLRPEGKSWYEGTVARGGSRYIGLPERIPALELRNAALKDHEFVPLCRLFSSDRFVAEGVVEVLQDAETFFAPAERVRRLNEDIGVFVLDAEGRQAYPFGAGASRAGGYYSSLIARGRLAPMEMRSLPGPEGAGGGAEEVATFMRSEYSGWDVVVVEPKAAAYLPLRRFTAILALSSIAMLALGWVAAYIAARRLAVPLKEFQAALAGMDALGLVDPSMGPPSIGRASIREIDGLRLAFGDMYEKLRSSTKELVATRSEETKARMLALQSLMNPHFIYNNLAAIGEMAEEGRNADIKTMCDDVSRILRYVSSGAEDGVELREEIDHTERYLKCMKVRYGDSLDYEIDVPEEMLSLVVPKLVVQPLAENSIKHGFDVSPPWRLSVKGRLEGGSWRIEVSDDGIGFEPGALARLEAQVGTWADTGRLPPLGIDGMGLLNIVLRLRMLYGADFVFDVSEAPGGGARVAVGGRADGR
jgi:two-component system, sensor histidine kinase YesM